MKPIRLVLLALVCGVFLTQNSQATLYLITQIVGYSTGQLGSSPSTGTGEGWNNPTAQVTVTNGSGSLDGATLGLVASAGDKVEISATASLTVRNNWAPNGTFTQAVETNIYYSFLYRFDDATQVSANGYKFSMVNRANSGATTGIHWELQAKNVAGQIQIGIDKALGNTTNYATTNISSGETFFVVLRQHIIPGAQNDIYDLWINPPTNTFGLDESAVPPSSAQTGTLTTDGTEDASTTGPERFWLASGASANFDEFRIASSWAEVTPPFGTCDNAGVTDPTNQTVTGDVPASFTVALSGTSPSVSWQKSTNSGTTWTNINGAVLRTYTTPNTTLADNGTLYRAIARCSCNGSTATSAVASVTVIAPVITPVGLVVDDFFDDQLRDNTPVATNNSVWRTSGASGNLDATSLDMVATPISASSSLWLGYFTDDSVTNLPVHLDIGRMIRATLVFTPNSFNAFTNNASLRFGLFDYADGGTRLTADGFTGGGSGGNGQGVRGYMLSLDFGTNFVANSPLQLLARNNLSDINLMGTTGDYFSLGSGPSGGGYSNSPSFTAGTQYTLTFAVTRTGQNAVNLATTIAGGGTNWSFSVIETNFAYHRFDAFGIRPNSLENVADTFTFPEFRVEVIPVVTSPFNITAFQVLSPTATRLTWNSVSNINYQVQSIDSLTTGGWVTNATITADSSSTSYTNSPIPGGVTQRYYRVVALPPP